MSGFFSIPVVYIDNRGQFLIPYFIYFSWILDRSGGGAFFPWSNQTLEIMDVPFLVCFCLLIIYQSSNSAKLL